MHWTTLLLLIFGVVVASLDHYNSGPGCHAICDEDGWCTDVCPGTQQQQQQQLQQLGSNQNSQSSSYSQYNQPDPIPEPEYHSSSWNVPNPEPEPEHNYGWIVPRHETDPKPKPEPQTLWLPHPPPPYSPMCDLAHAPCMSGGVCKPGAQCELNEDMVGRCPGLMCSCCVPQPMCAALGTQCSDNGVCRTDCEVHEVLVGSCMGTGCKCCSADPTCYGGTCRYICKKFEVSTSLCDGPVKNIHCCEDNTDTHQDCVEEGHPCVGHSYNSENPEHSGTCRPHCDDDHEEELGHCKGDHCKCCYKKAHSKKKSSHSKHWYQ